MRAAPRIEALSALLTTALPSLARETSCSCATCEAKRAVVHVCTVCGYAGAPFVHPCCCDDHRKQLISCHREQSGRTDLALEDRTRWQSQVGAALDDMGIQCDPADRSCGHGDTYCPGCCNSTTGAESYFPDDAADQAHLWGIIRELRAALRARGLT